MITILVEKLIFIYIIYKLYVNDIKNENIGINTEYCYDSNGNSEFKCECNEGFDGKRCEDECSLDCGIHGSCTTEINITTGTKEWIWLCSGAICHNGGTCTTTSQTDSQLGFIDNF